MTRRALAFMCERDHLAATLDEADAATGLLIVTGGNEIRAGAFNGQSLLAHEIAKAGFPVLRFDRRGVGDSEGKNAGFRGSDSDLRSAVETFTKIQPQLRRIVGFGNCDAASALMLASGAGCDALVLSNPWTIEEIDGAEPSVPPPASVRARYLSKLKQPREIWRLLSGGVHLGKLARGLQHAASRAPERSDLTVDMAGGLARFPGPVRILIAQSDRTAQMFTAQWDRNDPRLAFCPGAGHAYAEPHARAWLRSQLLDALSE